MGYRGPEYFCDRKAESAALLNYMQNGVHVAMFAQRRLGKTGLIQHVFHPFERAQKMVCIYMDILSTQNITEFTNHLATAVYNRFPPRQSIGKTLVELIQRMRPTINFDELSGLPSVALNLDTKSQKENTVGQILKTLDTQGVKVVIAIDEFQQILEYPETNTEAILRAQMQHLKNTTFIFCGSNQKMMQQLFNSAKRPFYASCTSLTLDKIDEVSYRKFIKHHFTAHKRTIDDECIDFILEWSCRHTFYSQYICNTLFARNKKHTQLQDAYDTAVEILLLHESTFYQYRNLLTTAQWNLLRAIAKEVKVYQPQSKQFIQKHALGTPALVKRGIDALLEKDLIFYDSCSDEPYYEVYDKFLLRWLKAR